MKEVVQKNYINKQLPRQNIHFFTCLRTVFIFIFCLKTTKAILFQPNSKNNNVSIHTIQQEIKSEINSSSKKVTKREQNKNRPIASSKFLKDPVRNSNVPDILGQFIDPMGCRATYTQGIDPTNTGA